METNRCHIRFVSLSVARLVMLVKGGCANGGCRYHGCFTEVKKDRFRKHRTKKLLWSKYSKTFRKLLFFRMATAKIKEKQFASLSQKPKENMHFRSHGTLGPCAVHARTMRGPCAGLGNLVQGGGGQWGQRMVYQDILLRTFFFSIGFAKNRFWKNSFGAKLQKYEEK